MSYTLDQIMEHFRQEISNETKRPLDQISVEATFYALGLDSISAVFIMEAIESEYHVEISPMCFWDYPTIRQLAEHILELTKAS